jgi:beta-galactosidase
MLHYGADYYPEHWPEERWPLDARLMQEAGFNTVRLGEFAWSRLEPAPDRFDFGWLDRAIDLLGAHGIQVVLGTPTASPPPWVMTLCPDAYRVAEDGRRVTYGNRRPYCPSHPGYRERSLAIVRAMAEHYAAHPHVVAWQIDNEFGERCYCPLCAAGFRDWLRARYGSLAALNRAWGTIFWSHVYTDWAQIPLPLASGGVPNPSLALDYRRFVSDLYGEYLGLQLRELRRYCPRHIITHNLMGFGYEGLNSYDLARPLDVVSWDNYPRFYPQATESTDPAVAALSHDTMRGLKGQGFWVMEEQAGPTGWELVGEAPRPGEIRLWAYQALAHGADGIVFFRWRSCRFGTEQFWHGLLDHDGRPRHRYEEASRLGAELARLGDRLAGSSVRAPVALINCYDSRFAFQVQPNNPAFSYPRHFLDLYQALQSRNVPVDVVAPGADLSPYRLVLAPALYVVPPEVAANLERFVERGGILLLTARTGVKEESNVVVDLPLPGLLAPLCGVEVDEYDSLPPGVTRPLVCTWPQRDRDCTPEATIWCDVLAPRAAEVVARYGGGYYAGRPAATRRSAGRGQAVYVGTMGNAALLQGLVDWLLVQAGVQPLLDTPRGVEAVARWAGEERLLFVLNHTGEAQTVPLDRPYEELVREQPVSGALILPARGVALLH